MRTFINLALLYLITLGAELIVYLCCCMVDLDNFDAGDVIVLMVFAIVLVTIHLFYEWDEFKAVLNCKNPVGELVQEYAPIYLKVFVVMIVLAFLNTFWHHYRMHKMLKHQWRPPITATVYAPAKP